MTTINARPVKGKTKDQTVTRPCGCVWKRVRQAAQRHGKRHRWAYRPVTRCETHKREAEQVTGILGAFVAGVMFGAFFRGRLYDGE